MIDRRIILLAALICVGCSPRGPTVIDPEHPELRHWQMFVDDSYKWPTTQPTTRPTEGKDMIDYRVYIRLSEYAPERLDGIVVAIQDVMPIQPESWSTDNLIGGIKANGIYCVGPGLEAVRVVTDLSRAVWKANGGWCRVQVGLVCLRPDWHCLGREEYAPF